MHRLTFVLAGCAAGSAAWVNTKLVFAASGSEGKKFIKLSELPIYDSLDISPQQFEIEPEKISVLRSCIRDARKVVWEYLDSVEDKAKSVSDKLRTAKAHTESFLSYVHEDSSFVARAAIISVAGLGGIVAGYRGGILKKAFYSSLLATGAASVCYPKEASELFNDSWSLVKEKSTELLYPNNNKAESSPRPAEDPESKKAVTDGDAAEVQLKLTKSTEDIKKDFGMSKPEDKDLYANRSN